MQSVNILAEIILELFYMDVMFYLYIIFYIYL